MRIVLIPFILALALHSSGCVLNLFWQAPDRPSETIYVPTSDGWKLAIYHYPPRQIDPKRPPVILCHGMACNHTFWNIADYCNFVGYLQESGWDVYTVDLRGHGNSRRENPFKDFIAVPGLAESAKKDPFAWTVDDYIRIDVPTIIGAVREKTGREQVFWIGHSMGGMVMYGFLETGEHPEWVKGFVTLGSPLMIPQPPSALLKAEADQPRFLRHALLTIGLKQPATALAPVLPLMHTPLDILYYNRNNVRVDTINRMYANCLENIPKGVSDQMMDMIALGNFQTAEQDFDYFENAKKISIPMLLISAKVDNCAPPMAVRLAYHQISSGDKTYVELSLADRFSVDYGHCDMIWGPKAPQEVYPIIRNWLDERR